MRSEPGKGQYEYDNRNELVQAKEFDASSALVLEADYKYDVYGNRIEQDVTQSGATTVQRYALDGWNPAKSNPVGNEDFDVWADLDGSNNLETRYLRGDNIDQILGRVDVSGGSGTAYWTLTDSQGSVRDVIDNTGVVKDSISYDAFGNITTENDATYRGRYAWTGRELDVETGLQYNRARYYDSTTGRWISQDPLGFDAGDSNLYRYVHNVPIGPEDPSGLQQDDATEAATLRQQAVDLYLSSDIAKNTYLAMVEQLKKDFPTAKTSSDQRSEATCLSRKRDAPHLCWASTIFEMTTACFPLFC
jgi:RHS repeat-associated protein